MSPRRAAAILLLGATLFAGSIAPAQTSFEDAFAKEGEGFLFMVDMQRDGSPGVGDMELDESGRVLTYRTKGRTTIESSRLNLVADFFNYDGVAGTVTCSGSVEVRQDGVVATGESMTYTIASGEITMTGSPKVQQTTATGKSRFEGMEEFYLKRGDAGDLQVRLSGGTEILCEMIPAESAATPTPTPAPGTAARPAALTGSGFAGLGNNVLIKTRPKESQPALVLAAVAASGAFSSFRATGSVLVESDDLRLRSDELEYDAIRERVEARRNVYLKQAAIEADCQSLTYDIKIGRIELSGQPDIRETVPNGVRRLYDMAAYIMTRSPDGSIATQSIAGPDGPFKAQLIPNGKSPQETEAPAPATDEGEININDPGELDKLGNNGK